MHVARISSLGGASIVLAFVLGTGCSSSSSGGSGGTDGGGDDATGSSSGGSSSSGSSSSGASSSSSSSSSSGGTEGGSEAGGSDAGCSGATPVALTVKNYLSWCSVSVAGHAASTDAAQTVCVAAGAVTLTATPASATFEIGTAPWHGTAGDTGSGDPGTISGMMSTIMVTASGASKCVWACCPFTSGTGCSGLPNQCP